MCDTTAWIPPTNKVKDARAEKRRIRERARTKRENAARRKALSNPDRASVKPRWVSINEFKFLTGLSRSTLHRAIADGQIESIKVRGRRLLMLPEKAE